MKQGEVRLARAELLLVKRELDRPQRPRSQRGVMRIVGSDDRGSKKIKYKPERKERDQESALAGSPARQANCFQ